MDFYDRILKKLDQRILARYFAKTAGSGDQSSVSDDGKYPTFCRAASENRFLFHHFRRNEIYNLILEHLSAERGQQYLDEILAKPQADELVRSLSVYRQNDRVGSPRVSEYALRGQRLRISPTTLRYVKVLADLQEWIPLREVHTVAEIGVGYGGQCRVISAAQPMKCYRLVDLPEALALTGRYLRRYPQVTGTEFIDGMTIGDREPCSQDLVISNYAYSELARNVQKIYLEKVIRGSAHGYITWNLESEQNLDGFTTEEFLALVKDFGRNVRVMEEKPLTAEGNCIIVW